MRDKNWLDMADERKYRVTRRVFDKEEEVVVVEREKTDGEIHKFLKPTSDHATGYYGHLVGDREAPNQVKRESKGSVTSAMTANPNAIELPAIKRDVEGPIYFKNAHADLYIGGRKRPHYRLSKPSISATGLPTSFSTTPETVLPAGSTVSSFTWDQNMLEGTAGSVIAVFDRHEYSQHLD